jgi:enamine deaminase RidA (YjgF/YER057c/UK114 family)
MRPTLPKIAVLVLAAAVGGCASTAPSAPPPQVIRHPNPAPTSPTSRAVEVPGGKTLVFVSGQTPEPANPSAPQYSAEYWGDTKGQTLSVLRKIEAQLKSVGLGMGDVVKMQSFLVGDVSKGGRFDSAGYAEAYAQHFGTAAQPNKPARTTMQIAALGAPGMLVEIDVIAVRP